MAQYLNVTTSNSTGGVETLKAYRLTDEIPDKPYAQVGNAYVPLVTTTSTIEGPKLEICPRDSDGNVTATYRPMEFDSFYTNTDIVSESSRSSQYTASWRGVFPATTVNIGHVNSVTYTEMEYLRAGYAGYTHEKRYKSSLVKDLFDRYSTTYTDTMELPFLIKTLEVTSQGEDPTHWYNNISYIGQTSKLVAKVTKKSLRPIPNSEWTKFTEFESVYKFYTRGYMDYKMESIQTYTSIHNGVETITFEALSKGVIESIIFPGYTSSNLYTTEGTYTENHTQQTFTNFLDSWTYELTYTDALQKDVDSNYYSLKVPFTMQYYGMPWKDVKYLNWGTNSVYKSRSSMSSSHDYLYTIGESNLGYNEALYATIGSELTMYVDREMTVAFGDRYASPAVELIRVSKYDSEYYRTDNVSYCTIDYVNNAVSTTLESISPYKGDDIIQVRIINTNSAYTQPARSDSYTLPISSYSNVRLDSRFTYGIGINPNVYEKMESSVRQTEMLYAGFRLTVPAGTSAQFSSESDSRTFTEARTGSRTSSYTFLTSSITETGSWR